jgi:crooked neck
MPETLWKAYIDFEIAEGDSTRARALYERLLQRTQHVKVWTSFGAFEAKEGEGIASARAVYERAYSALKAAGLNEVSVELLLSSSGKLQHSAHHTAAP